MLIGNAVHSVDAKGRVVIPSKYRGDLGTEVCAYKSTDGCIRIYPRAKFLIALDKLCAGNARTTQLRRKILISAEELNVDGQGRILVSEELRKAAGITDKVRMVGMVDWLEFWCEETLLDHEDNLSQEDEIALMAELGLA